MERRVEPRFQINSRVKVTVLGNPERSVQCHLLDISATGMRLVSDDRILENEVVALEVADHPVLARILRSHWRGDAYVIGAERIDAIPQNGASEDQPEETPEPVATETVEEPIEVAAEIPEAKPEEPEANSEEPEEKPDEPEPALADAPAMPEVPLRPPTLRPAMPMPAVADPASAPGRSWRVAAALAASFAIAVVGLVYFLQSRSHANAVQEPQAVAEQRSVPAAPVVQEQAAVKTPPPASRPVQSAPPALSRAPARVPSAHRVEVQGLSESWVAATADGKPLFGKVFATGDTQEFEFSGIAFLHLGRAGGVEIAVDGKPLGPLGLPGQMRLIELTPAGMQFLPWSNGDPVVDPKK